MLKKIIFIAFIFSCFEAYSASSAPTQGRQCMAVSAQHYATEVGFNVLKQGGNAVDAAVAMGYALAVVHPCCGNIGGGGFMLIRFANGQTTFLNFREKAPLRTKPELFLDKDSHVQFKNLSTGHVKGHLDRPYMAVGVPGTVMGLNTALDKYGTKPLREVIKPAIDLAEKGFVLDPGDVSILQTGENSFKLQPNVAAIFLKDGASYQIGDKIIQKNLARTLKEIAAKGTAAFYEGSIAAKIVKASKQNGGLIQKQDLKNYTVEEMRPIFCDYRGYQVITTPPPGSGATICEALKILEAYPLAKYGFHSARASHYIIEALRVAYADRNRYLGDPNFIVNPIEKLLSPAYIQAMRAKIKKNSSTSPKQIAFKPAEGSNTTSYVVVDKKGNAVSVTYTLNDFFGAKVIPGDSGFFLNNELADFTIKPGTANSYSLYQGAQNLIAANKRPLSSMAPTILTKDHALFMVIGTPGGSTIPSQLINVILNVLDYGMNIQEAENAPKFHMQSLPNLIYMEPFAFSKDTEVLLHKMGYVFKLGSPYGTPLWGAVSGILLDPKTKKLYGAMDCRRQSGAAIGE